MSQMKSIGSQPRAAASAATVLPACCGSFGEIETCSHQCHNGVVDHLEGFTPSLHVRAEAFPGSEDDAQGLADKVSTFLNLFHAAETSVGSGAGDPDVKAFFDSLSVERQGDRAVLTASISPGFLRKVVAEPQPELPAASNSAAGQKPTTSPQQNKHHKGQD